MIRVFVTGLALLASRASAAYCSGSPDEGERTNEFPIFDEAPSFVRAQGNSSLYEGGPSNARFPIVHVYGNAYEVGYAQGSLQKEYMKEFIVKMEAYFINMALEELGDRISPFWQGVIIFKGLNRALDWCAEITAPYTPQEFYDEIRGLADGSGVDYQMLLRLNMFAELTKASCSFFGAWGEATAKDTGKTYQLRALDYDTTGPFKDFPQITIYHPTDGGHAFANMGWPGSIGIMTGYSAARMAISEIGVTFPDEPWMFITRDVMKYQESLESAVAYIEAAPRTCNLIIGVGDGEEGMVNGIEYSGYVAVPYNDENQLPVNDTWHPVIDDVVYNGMDWNCPAYTEKLGEQLEKYHGIISPESNIIHDILPTVQTGDLHAAVYDLTDGLMYVSFMRTEGADPSEPHYAYERQFTRLHMDEIFAVPKPTPLA